YPSDRTESDPHQCRHLSKAPLIRRPAENRYPDDEGMKHEAQRQIEDGSTYQRDDVAAAPADRNRRCAGIGAALERDPIVDRPGEKGAEQHDRSEIAVGTRCAAAQVFTPTSIGCLSLRQMSPRA